MCFSGDNLNGLDGILIILEKKFLFPPISQISLDFKRYQDFHFFRSITRISQTHYLKIQTTIHSFISTLGHIIYLINQITCLNNLIHTMI